MSNKFLISRWLENYKGKASLEAIIQLLQKGGTLIQTNSPFELLNDGILDFRGLVTSAMRIKNVKLKNIDLSYSSFKSTWIENSTFNDALFAKVDFSDFADHGNKFIDSSFLDCNFRKAAIGYRGTNFLNCNFDNCNFEKSIFIRAEFVGCKFLDCKIKNLDFNASSFEDCTFEGELNNVWFRGGFPLITDIREFGQPKENRMKNVSFEKADLTDLTFSNGCDLSSVRVKNNGRYYVYKNWNAILEMFKREIKYLEIKERKEAEIFVNTYLVHAKNQYWNIISLDDLERDYDVALSLKIIEYLNSYAIKES